MFSWQIGLLVSLGLLWLGVWAMLRAASDADDRAMRDYERARERLEDHFLDE